MTAPWLTASVDLPGLALVLATVGPTLAVILSWWEQHRAANKKEEIAQQERDAARATANAKLDNLKVTQDAIAEKQDVVHTIVNSQRTAMLATIEALQAEIARLRAQSPPQ